MKYLKITSLFVLLFTLMMALFLINFYHSDVELILASYFADLFILPWYTILVISGCVGVLIALMVISAKMATEHMQDEFTRIVTHKFRTPITELRWGIENVGKNISQQERDDLVKRMSQTTTRLLEIVDLLAGAAKFDRRLGYMYERSSLREMVESSLSKHAEFIRQKNLTFTVDSGKELPIVIIDRRNMQFAIDVLVNNAITYTKPGGTITISFAADGKYVTMKITDSGMGFSWSERKHIFTKFWRSPSAQAVDTEGMGLGLYTAKAIVESHNGKIWATSAGQNKGAEFYMQLKSEA